MVPSPAGGNQFYSVFPLGAVLVTVPSAILGKMHWVNGWPAHQTSSIVAGLCVFFFFGLSYVKEMSRMRRVMLSLFPIFATWTWTNLGFAGAWQMALGFAVLGQAGALYHTLIRPNPVLAGFWFAVAYGNRTELLITSPLYAYFWLSRPDPESNAPGMFEERGSILHLLRFWRLRWSDVRDFFRSPQVINVFRFAAIPIILLIFTMAYNLPRFDSVKDFGYARIPGVLNEPWYKNGIFSFQAIRWNAYEMLFRGFSDIPTFPFIAPYGFGCSIFAPCPLLFLLFREGGPRRVVCWIAILSLTLVLWMHGNTGGWQFSYRYAMVLLPWMFIVLAENGPKRLVIGETFLFLCSVALSGVGVYEFIWTNIVH